MLNRLKVSFAILAIGVFVSCQNVQENPCQTLNYMYRGKSKEFFQSISLSEIKLGWICFSQELPSTPQQSKFEFTVTATTGESYQQLDYPFSDNNILLLATNSPLEVTKEFMEKAILKNYTSIISGDFNSFYLKKSTTSILYQEKEGDFGNEVTKTVYFYLIFNYQLQNNDKSNIISQSIDKVMNPKIFLDFELNLNPYIKNFQKRHFYQTPTTIISFMDCSDKVDFKCTISPLYEKDNYSRKEYYLFFSIIQFQKLFEVNSLFLEFEQPKMTMQHKYLDDSLINDILPDQLFYSMMLQNKELEVFSAGKQIWIFDLENFRDPETQILKDLVIKIKNKSSHPFKYYFEKADNKQGKYTNLVNHAQQLHH